MPLTDAKLVLLSTASQRDDHLFPRPATLAGSALTKVEVSLVKAGFAEPLPVRADQPHWRQDLAGSPMGLRITPAGLAAIGIEASDATGHEVLQERTTPRGADVAGARSHDEAGSATSARSRSGPFRSGSKAAQLVGLLSRPEGATGEALAAALAWQSHAVRAALTRLRQSGFTLAASKDPQKRTVYRIDASDRTATADGTVAREVA